MALSPNSPHDAALLQDVLSCEGQRAACRASADMGRSPPTGASDVLKLDTLARTMSWRFRRDTHEPYPKTRFVRRRLTVAERRPQGIFGVPLRQSITYANVAISLVDEDGKSYIYGYVPIVVAKCGVFLKEKGEHTWARRMSRTC